jgi:MYXO-CTERM domain-containing protein
LLSIVAVLFAAAHPSLYFNSSDVPALRQAAQSTHSEIANHITTVLNAHLSDATPAKTDYGDFRLLGNQVAVWAFGYQLTGNTQYAAKALSEIKTYLGWPDWSNGEIAGSGPDLNEAHMMLGVALAYDWIYETLSAADRTAIATRLGTEAALVAAYQPAAWYRDEYLQNHNWIDTGALGMAGLVLQGEDSRAVGWISLAQTNLALLQQYLGAIQGGVWHEGLPYEGYGLAMALPFWQAMKHAGSDYTDMQLLSGYGDFFTYASIPDAPRELIVPFGDFTNWPAEMAMQILRFSASRFHNGVAEAMAQRFLKTGRDSLLPTVFYNVFEFLSYDPTVAPVDIHSHPLDGYFPEMGIATLHSKWDAGDFTLGFKAGVYGGWANFSRVEATGSYQAGGTGGWIDWGHDHNDDMTFWLYGGGSWLAPEAMGYDAGKNTAFTQKANETDYHNGILVDGNGQLGDLRASDSNWNNPWFFNRTSKALFAPAGTADYAIAGGTGPGLFDGSLGLTRWDRVLVMARGRYALVRDDIQSTVAHNYDWLCHFQDGVSVDTASGWVQGTGKAGMSVGVKVVSPASWTGTTGTQGASLMKNFDPDALTSFVKVRPAAAAADQQFLTALVPVKTASWASRTQVNALDANNAGAGLVVAPGSALEEHWVFVRNGAAGQSAGDLAITGSFAGMVAHDQSGTVMRSVVFGAGSIADQSGARVVLSTRSAKALEASLSGTTLLVTGQSVQDFQAYAPTAAAVTLNGVAVSVSSSGGVLTYPAAATQSDPSPPADAGTPPADGGTPAADGGTAVPVADAGNPGDGCGNCAPADAGADVGTAGSDDAGIAPADAVAPTATAVAASVVDTAHGCSSTGPAAGWLAITGLLVFFSRRAKRRRLAE